jgi:hypothetical protein
MATVGGRIAGATGVLFWVWTLMGPRCDFDLLRHVLKASTLVWDGPRPRFVESEKLVGKGEGGKNEDDEYFDLLPNI